MNWNDDDRENGPEGERMHPLDQYARRGGRPPKDTTEVVLVAAPESTNAIIDELQTIGPEELGRLIGRTRKSIKVDCHRRPQTLPPRFRIPGTRKLLWRVKDVRDWMDALAAQQAEERRKAVEVASRVGMKPADMMRALREHLAPKRRR
jgi:hypothetical protein